MDSAALGTGAGGAGHMLVKREQVRGAWPGYTSGKDQVLCLVMNK